MSSKFAIVYSDTNSDMSAKYVIKTRYFGNQGFQTLSQGGLYENGVQDSNVLSLTKTAIESRVKQYQEAKSLVYSVESGLILQLNANTVALLRSDKEKYGFALGRKKDNTGGYCIDQYSDILMVDHGLAAASSLEDLQTFSKKLAPIGVGL